MQTRGIAVACLLGITSNKLGLKTLTNDCGLAQQLAIALLALSLSNVEIESHPAELEA